MLIFEMAWNMSKDNLDMVWWAIVGSTEQAILGKVESRLSVLEEGSLQAHVSRLTHKQGVEVDKQQQQQSTVRITYDKEYPFEIRYHNRISYGINFISLHINLVSYLYYIGIGL